MCQFLSLLVLRNGDVLHHPMLDSHADLVNYFKLPDDRAHHQHFAKVELTPAADTWLTPDLWTWRIDEPARPAWLDDVEARAEAKARSIAKRMVITEAMDAPRLIVDGVWILGGTGVLRDVRGGRIMRVQDSAQISNVRDSAQISGVGDSVVLDASAMAAVSHD